eukprot:NODE_4890_length_1005_cov_33.435374_g4683_i0.p1 GENE.NODE_4890_length_1005_cov_33.435374_g4683_i0~~NODE_4890_length_1005_cov_33.435374_g4683_i0.p1  ORF type:complete len:227 (+),score=32.26 NODE_4890_length_1005_cov_33.435374_g4683_i0:56-736(+)
MPTATALRPIAYTTAFLMFCALVFIIIATSTTEWSRKSVTSGTTVSTTRIGLWNWCITTYVWTAQTGSEICTVITESNWHDKMDSDCAVRFRAAQAFSVVSLISSFISTVMLVIVPHIPNKRGPRMAVAGLAGFSVIVTAVTSLACFGLYFDYASLSVCGQFDKFEYSFILQVVAASCAWLALLVWFLLCCYWSVADTQTQEIATSPVGKAVNSRDLVLIHPVENA